MTQYIIGVDIGTTSTKVILYDEAGAQLARANNGYELYQDSTGMAEEDPDAIYQAVIKGLATVMQSGGVPATDIAGLAFSAAMHSMMLVDDDMAPLTRLMTWADTRARDAYDVICDAFDQDNFFEHVPIPAHPMTPLAKLIWLREQNSALLSQTRYVLGIKEYVLYRMTGELVEDYSVASATGLMDVQTMQWYDGALKLTGIRQEQLPTLVDTNYQIHGLRPAVAEATGLAVATTVVVGASDGALSNLGLGATQPGDVAVNVGTSGAARVIVDHVVTDPHHALFTYYVAPHQWLVGGSLSNGGNVLRWAQTALFPQLPDAAKQVGTTSEATLMHAVAELPAGADGVLCVPYFNGSRAPLWDPDSRASFYGLSAQHTRTHMARAALEGVAYGLKVVLDDLEDLTGRAVTIRVGGGLAQSDVWRTMLAGVLNQAVMVPDSVDSSALGAAIMGLRSLGIDAAAMEQTAQSAGKVVEPDEADAAAYATLYGIWSEIIYNNDEVDDQLAAFQAGRKWEI